MENIAFEPLLIVLLIVLSLNLGILSLYAHTIMPALKHLDSATFVKAFQSIDKSIINPIFMIQFFVPLVLFTAVVYLAYSQSYAGTKYLLIGAVAYLLTIIFTVVINVPLNDGIKKVSAASNADVLSQARIAFNEAKWTASNIARTITNAISVIAVAIALFLHK
jgi:uncharacterized membrane protein